jgi:acetyl esterase/lipase
VVVIAGFDVRRDEGEGHARALAEAGIAVRVVRALSLEHGFIHTTGICPAAREAMTANAREWRTLVREASLT